MGLIDNERYKAVVFDFDDTLVGSHEAAWALHKHIARKFYDIDLQDTVLREHWGRPLTTLARQYYQTTDTAQAINLMNSHQDDFPKQTFEHSVPTLRRIRAANKIIGLLTATTKPILAKDVQRANIAINAFDYIQTSEDTDVHKPDPEVFEPLLEWAKLRGVPKESVLYVGDSMHDMDAAIGAEVSFIGVTTGLVSAENFADHGIPYIENLSMLK